MANYLYDRMQSRLIAAGTIALIVVSLSIVVGIGYVLIHFVAKFW